ncbi:MAG: hypothetical protein EAZ41_07270 [Sphingobacteriia bacterium]|nr:MAG: hypothetical protein EAZ41_07270 [Sphingobacteriia bacterium]
MVTRSGTELQSFDNAIGFGMLFIIEMKFSQANSLVLNLYLVKNLILKTLTKFIFNNILLVSMLPAYA